MRSANPRPARRNARTKLTAAIAISALLGAAGLVSSSAASASAASPVPPVAWHRCPAGSAAAMAGGFLCATVAAPLDYRNPSGAKIRLAVVEHRGHRASPPWCDLLQPGRPRWPWHGAAPAVDRALAEGAAARVRHRELGPARVRGEHRGPVLRQCGRGKRLPRQVRLCSPSARRQQRAYIRRWREFGKICAARNGALLRHVSTADSARDLNLLRQALGQPKLNYLGISYGTFLGATYANLFPRRVGRWCWTGTSRPRPGPTAGGRTPGWAPTCAWAATSGRQGARLRSCASAGSAAPRRARSRRAAPPRPRPSGMRSWPGSGGRPSP